MLLPGQLPGNEAIREHWVSPTLLSTHNPDIVYHCMQKVMMSRDQGQTWEDISGNVPVTLVNVIREDPKDENILYEGTDAGVYISKDKGKLTRCLVICNLPIYLIYKFFQEII